ncbi:MAG: NTP transferase domain-containing protein [Candidatus Lokiarchaeota archaeon]|nr:NTP transferase domain-containing protein [Candidatus Lokiarchaeota archaeon]
MKLRNNAYVIILAAGKATRLRPLSDQIPKPLIKINGIPMITHIVSNFKQAGYSKFIILVGYKQELIRAELLKIQDIELQIIEQVKQVGSADALMLCLNQFSDFKSSVLKFFVTAADIIFFKKEINLMYSLYCNSKADIILSLMKSKDKDIALGHGNVKVFKNSDLIQDSDSNRGLDIVDIVEKPRRDQILSDYYSLPLYIFNQTIIKNLKGVDISIRGEKEIQEAIKISIQNGYRVKGIKIIDSDVTSENVGRYHITFLSDIEKMNERFRELKEKRKFK